MRIYKMLLISESYIKKKIQFDNKKVCIFEQFLFLFTLYNIVRILTQGQNTLGPAYNEFGYNEHPAIASPK